MSNPNSPAQGGTLYIGSEPVNPNPNSFAQGGTLYIDSEPVNSNPNSTPWDNLTEQQPSAPTPVPEPAPAPTSEPAPAPQPEEKPKEPSIWDEVDQAPAGQTANTQQDDLSNDEFDFHKRKTAETEKAEESKDSSFDSFFVENESEAPKTNPTPEAHAPTSEKTGETPKETARERGESAEKNHFIKENWEKLPKPVKTAIVGGGIITLAVVGAVPSFITSIINSGKKAEAIPTPLPTTNEQPSENTEEEEAAEEGEVLPYGELTGNPEYDKSVDGSFAQFGDVGMTDTEKHTDENPNVGKFSKYSNAAPNDLAREYYGVEKYEDLSLEEKVTCHSMACYKQDFCAMHILHIIDPDYKDMSFETAVMTFRESDQSEKDEAIEKIKDFFTNATPRETTVGDLAKVLPSLPGAEEITKWLETQTDGTLVENEMEIKDKLTCTHTYSIDHAPVKQTVATPDSAKVLEYTYAVSETEEATIYVLERCFNGFIVTKTTDKITKQTKLTVTFFGEEEKLDKKNTEAEKKNMGNEYTDERKIDEKVTPKTTEQEDKQGFKEIEEQKKADEEKARQDEAERQRQQEAEKQAAAEAERVAAEQANKEAEERAAKEAAEKQRQAAEAEKQRAAEEEARRKAQEEVDRKAAEEKKAAEEASKNDENRDANDWANGDFSLN